MGDTTDELLRLAHEVSPTPVPREVDMLISVGERVSCALAAMAIHDLGHDAISLTGSQAGIVTDTMHGRAKIVDVRARRIHEALDADRIVLVAGFQGVSTAYDVTTLGRGGSNPTAVALAAALGADARDVHDVEGVFTADYGLVPTARKLHAVSYEEMLEMAASGAKVSSYARSSSRAATASSSTFARASATRTAPDPGGGRTDAREGDHLRRHAHARGVGLPRGGRRRRAAVPGAVGGGGQRGHDRPDRARDRFPGPSSDAGDTASALDKLGVSWTSRDDLGKVSVIGAG